MIPKHDVVDGVPVDAQLPAPSPIASAKATLTRANTETTGYLGLALVIASYVIPAVAPDIDASLERAHIPPILAHALVAAIGAICALLGRWRTFSADS